MPARDLTIPLQMQNIRLQAQSQPPNYLSAAWICREPIYGWLASSVTSDDPHKNYRQCDYGDVHRKSAASILACVGQLTVPLHAIRMGSIAPVTHRLKALEFFAVHTCIEQPGQFEHNLDKLLIGILRVKESMWIE